MAELRTNFSGGQKVEDHHYVDGDIELKDPFEVMHVTVKFPDPEQHHYAVGVIIMDDSGRESEPSNLASFQFTHVITTPTTTTSSTDATIMTSRSIEVPTNPPFESFSTQVKVIVAVCSSILGVAIIVGIVLIVCCCCRPKCARTRRRLTRNDPDGPNDPIYDSIVGSPRPSNYDANIMEAAGGTDNNSMTPREESSPMENSTDGRNITRHDPFAASGSYARELPSAQTDQFELTEIADSPPALPKKKGDYRHIKDGQLPKKEGNYGQRRNPPPPQDGFSTPTDHGPGCCHCHNVPNHQAQGHNLQDSHAQGYHAQGHSVPCQHAQGHSVPCQQAQGHNVPRQHVQDHNVPCQHAQSHNVPCQYAEGHNVPCQHAQGHNVPGHQGHYVPDSQQHFQEKCPRLPPPLNKKKMPPPVAGRPRQSKILKAQSKALTPVQENAMMDTPTINIHHTSIDDISKRDTLCEQFTDAQFNDALDADDPYLTRNQYRPHDRESGVYTNVLIEHSSQGNHGVHPTTSETTEPILPPATTTKATAPSTSALLTMQQQPDDVVVNINPKGPNWKFRPSPEGSSGPYTIPGASSQAHHNIVRPNKSDDIENPFARSSLYEQIGADLPSDPQMFEEWKDPIKPPVFVRGGPFSYLPKGDLLKK